MTTPHTAPHPLDTIALRLPLAPLESLPGSGLSHHEGAGVGSHFRSIFWGEGDVPSKKHGPWHQGLLGRSGWAWPGDGADWKEARDGTGNSSDGAGGICAQGQPFSIEKGPPDSAHSLWQAPLADPGSKSCVFCRSGSPVCSGKAGHTVGPQ